MGRITKFLFLIQEIKKKKEEKKEKEKERERDGQRQRDRQRQRQTELLVTLGSFKALLPRVIRSK